MLARAKDAVLPASPMSLPILRGPLRGGRFYASPRVSLRKVLGLYESELNPWLSQAMQKTDFVFDVGANDGYFTFGCAAAMKRHGKPVRIIGFEPLVEHQQQLETARAQAGLTEAEMRIVPKLVGRADGPGIVTLDSFAELAATVNAPLIKIDVEGAEIDVLVGASRWLSRNCLLLIEVHNAAFLDEIPRRWEAVVGPLDRVDQKALPLLGREQRIAENWWLVSRRS